MSFQPRKAVFEVIRQMLGRGFHQSEVERLDMALDCDAGDASRCAAVAANEGRAVSAQGIALIKRFEGCASKRADGLVEAYPDPASGAEPWTIGWGATGREIGPETVWTQEECDARLAADLKKYAREVTQAIGSTPTSQAQFDALVSFHYNTGAIARATLTRRHLTQDYDGAAAQFARWNRASGQVLKGLARRRSAEASLYKSLV
ncbi:lysozyme [Altererythrobacter aquiaggeris]|uniref:lysozyme n=1 Tax=Aestuarierythrobacter aquiaggeris TaxID=1898396 RepID=UPI00301837F7